MLLLPIYMPIPSILFSTEWLGLILFHHHFSISLKVTKVIFYRILTSRHQRIISWKRSRSSSPAFDWISPRPWNHITNCFIYSFLECSQGWRLGSPFQCLTLHSTKKYFPISTLNLPWPKLWLLPLVTLLVKSLKTTTFSWAISEYQI